MSAVAESEERIERVLGAARRLPALVPGIVAVGLAGSYARDAARADSDVDLVVLADRPSRMLSHEDWYAVFHQDAVLVRSEDFGAIQERRLRLPDSTVVEVGIGHPSWARTDPVDRGTRRVVSDGFRIVYDPHHLLEHLLRTVDRL